MEITIIELLNFVFSLVGLIIAIFIGSKVISKYFEYGRREYLLIGLVFILLTEPWWPSIILFLSLIITGSYIRLEIILLIGNILLPITTLLWLVVFNNLLDYKRKKVIYIIFIIHGLFFEILLFYFLLTDPSMIGEISGSVDVNYGIFVSLYHLTILAVALITCSLFAKICLNSDNPETNLKGKLILLALCSFVVGSILDILSANSVILLTLARIILILASIALYGGFILPNWMRKIFLKND
jgi:hypothetical protein